jgi:hypothetical protein
MGFLAMGALLEVLVESRKTLIALTSYLHLLWLLKMESQ